MKHDLVREYLNGWFPKMTLGPTGFRRVQYIDTHAGKGKFRTGEPGSPLVALTTLLRHSARDQMLRNSEINFYFIEAADENADFLRGELAKYYPLPNNVCAGVEGADCFQKFDLEIAEMEKEGKRLVPAFVFVDPYTFKLPGALLRKLLTYPQVELFVNVIWRELDMSIQQGLGRTGPAEPAHLGPNLFDPTPNPEQARAAAAQRRANAQAGMAASLDSIFDGDRWRSITGIDADTRAEQCAEVYRQMTGARWGTYLRMLDNHRVRYFLLHLTNHPDGRDLMKECMWKVCPDGNFYVSKSDDPKGTILLQAVPEFAPLQRWVMDRLRAGPRSWQSLADELREELWLERHLNGVLKSMRDEGLIEPEGNCKSFTRSANPCLKVAPRRPKPLELF